METAPEFNHNISIINNLKINAEDKPFQKALIFTEGWDDYGRAAYTHLTYQQLNQETDELAHGFCQTGIGRGARTLVMLPPCLEFFTSTYALLKIGAVPIFAPRFMPVKELLQCIRAVRAIVADTHFQFLRFTHPGIFKKIRVCITCGKRWFWGGMRLDELYGHSSEVFPALKISYDEIAAVFYTSGLSGPPKGVAYTHDELAALINYSDAVEINLPLTPLPAILGPAGGKTIVIPDTDWSTNPEKIIETMEDQGINHFTAHCETLTYLGACLKTKKHKLSGLKKIDCIGPVIPDRIKDMVAGIDAETDIQAIYSTLENGPLLAIDGREIINETAKFSAKGYGLCLGYPFEGIELNIIKVNDHAIEVWSEDMEVNDSEIGEITVQKSLVAARYFEHPGKDSLTLIKVADRLWYRTGDLGWKDNKGRFWFVGRKDERLVTDNGTIYPWPCESLFNSHPEVYRSALVGIGRRPHQKPVICIETVNTLNNTAKNKIRKDLLNLAARNPITKEINKVVFFKALPVNPDCPAKIVRTKLLIKTTYF